MIDDCAQQKTVGRRIHHKGRQDKNLASCKGCFPKKTLGNIKEGQTYQQEGVHQAADTSVNRSEKSQVNAEIGNKQAQYQCE